MKIAKGAKGATPPGIGLGWPFSSPSFSAWADLVQKRPVPSTLPAVAALPRKARREPWMSLLFMFFLLVDQNTIAIQIRSQWGGRNRRKRNPIVLSSSYPNPQERLTRPLLYVDCYRLAECASNRHDQR